MEETKTETQTQIETQTETSIEERIFSKVLHFVNQYTVDYLGQEFIDNWITLDKLTDGNMRFVESLMPQLLEKLPITKQYYINLNHKRRTTKMTWTNYLMDIWCIGNLINAPIIDNILNINYIDSYYSFEKHRELNYENKIYTLMTEIVLMV